MSSILDLEKQERWAEAGYGRIFAYESLHFNATIDARTKAKYVRERNVTYDETQHQLIYSGPTVFVDKRISIDGYSIIKADIKSAYPSYLINQYIKKPGIRRYKIDGAAPLSKHITLYSIAFSCSNENLFVKWFLNSNIIQKKKIKTNGRITWGEISIFSSVDMNLMKYVNEMLGDGATVIKSFIFYGREVVTVEKTQLRKLYQIKESGIPMAKQELNAATGWLSLIDRPTYYHMVQYIKFWLLETVYKYRLQDDLIGIQTDCLYYRINETTKDVMTSIMKDKLTLSNERSTMGTYKFELVKEDDLIIKTQRMVIKNENISTKARQYQVFRPLVNT